MNTDFIIIFVLVINVISLWRLFGKAGKPGWAALIPGYNIFVFLEIIGKPWWWLMLMLIPIINIIFIFWSANLFRKCFGDKSVWSTVFLLIFPYLWLPLAAFDKHTVYHKIN
jgi:uncharacterized membrane protein YoaK (UPF0700 family)